MRVQTASSGETESARHDQATTLWAIQTGDVTLRGFQPPFLTGSKHALRQPPRYPAARIETHPAHSLLRSLHGQPLRGTAVWQRLRHYSLAEFSRESHPVIDRVSVHLDAARKFLRQLLALPNAPHANEFGN